ncbi:MAG: hypothetical protein ACOYM3_28280, partial [Terrimicrobiaceae bacterium]
MNEMPTINWCPSMQVILPYADSPEKYVENEAYRKLPPPTKCPHCLTKSSLEVLGYYRRGLSELDSAKILTILVKRFFCRRCGRTVSLLPSFAQPYRLVRNLLVEQFFSKEVNGHGVRSWRYLLSRYWRRFVRWIPQLELAAFGWAGRPPPDSDADVWWFFLLRVFGDIEEITRGLVSVSRVTLFGRYQCHQPV